MHDPNADLELRKLQPFPSLSLLAKIFSSMKIKTKNIKDSSRPLLVPSWKPQLAPLNSHTHIL